MKKIDKIFVLVSIFLGVFCFWNIALAEIVTPDIQIEIGEFSGWNEDQGWTQTGNSLQIEWIGQYVGAIYKYGVAAAAVLAVVMIMVGGFLWVVSAGNPNQISTAKDFITSALTGLVLALFSFIILQTVNPRLVTLDPLTVQTPETIEQTAGALGSAQVDTDEFGSEGEFNLTGTCCVCSPTQYNDEGTRDVVCLPGLDKGACNDRNAGTSFACTHRTRACETIAVCPEYTGN